MSAAETQLCKTEDFYWNAWVLRRWCEILCNSLALQEMEHGSPPTGSSAAREVWEGGMDASHPEGGHGHLQQLIWTEQPRKKHLWSRNATEHSQYSRVCSSRVVTLPPPGGFVSQSLCGCPSLWLWHRALWQVIFCCAAQSWAGHLLSEKGWPAKTWIIYFKK